MTPELRSTLIKVAIPLAGIVVPMLVAKLRGYELREFFGLYKPPARMFGIALLLWIVWIAVSEAIMQQLGVGHASPWPERPLLVNVLRVLAIGIIGPIAEELFFRGLLFSRLQPRIGAIATIVLVAVAFGLIHYRYDAATIAFVCLDGLIFGYARHKTGSVFTPMAMHSLGNLFSIWQSLS